MSLRVKAIVEICRTRQAAYRNILYRFRRLRSREAAGILVCDQCGRTARFPKGQVMRNSAVSAVLFTAVVMAGGDSLGTGQVRPNPITSGYGAAGRHTVVVDSIPHTEWRGKFIYLIRPASFQHRYPVVLFCHGLGADHPDTYAELLRHIASRGHAILYPPFPTALAAARPENAYRMLHRGFESAVRHWKELLDTTRIAVAGHSYGGGAVPSVAWRWLSEKGWGAAGAMLFIVAPWYSYGIAQQELEEFPPQATLLMTVLEDDHINDHRMAKDIFDNIAIPPVRKNFIILHSDSSGARTLTADHPIPAGSAAGQEVNELHYYGIWRLFDALSEYALRGDAAAKDIALGSGSEAQRFMGRRENGNPVRELTGGHTAILLFPQSNYLNFWNHTLNPRHRRTTFFNALPFWRHSGRMTLRNYATLRAGSDADSILASHSTGNLDFPPIDSGFGSTGPYRVRKRAFPQPSLGHGKVYVFSPVDAPEPAPAIVFLHGFQWPMPDFYQGLIKNLASQGYHVVFPSYLLYRTSLNNRKRYDLMLKGAAEAFSLLGAAVDTSRLGFIGHSYGGGAVPAVAWHYVKLKEWGRRGAFLFIMAPWYVHFIDPHEFEYFPSHVKLVVQVYEDERFNDWRMAEDLFYSFRTIPFSEKVFVTVHNDVYGGSRMEAEHVSPLSSGDGDIDAIDHYAIYRIAHALAAYAFDGDPAGRAIALGNGSAAQVFMGTWPDGTPVTALTVTDRPITPYSEDSYLFEWRRPWNRRRGHYTPREPAMPELIHRIRTRRKE
ncbi:MAG: hypothetical protein GF418_03325 [Chitinivibrionales bacterium]|nr:hypothetical protein [Chitinivibrionales bacterium]MBD3394634.1 hypothetical protein [Chitinivibrionales bacterium]